MRLYIVPVAAVPPCGDKYHQQDYDTVQQQGRDRLGHGQVKGPDRTAVGQGFHDLPLIFSFSGNAESLPRRSVRQVTGGEAVPAASFGR